MRGIPRTVYATLSIVSGRGLWILVDPTTLNIVSEISWSDTNATGLSTQIAPYFEKLLAGQNIPRESLTALWGVSGPGAFTGLRSACAFLQGLARALNIPLRAIPSYDLFAQEFFLPLRHQKAATLSAAECIESGIEFLHVINATEFVIESPKTNDLVVGITGRADWPTGAELVRGLTKNLHRAEGLEIFYGLEPKISGVRTPQ